MSRVLVAGLAGLVATTAAVAAVTLPDVPRVLRDPGSYASVRFTDRSGLVLRQTRGARGTHARWAPLAEIPTPLVRAVLASEDHDFFAHHGVDPVAIVRAAWLDLWAGRVVSGGSTISMQLARIAWDLPRSPWGKLEQAALATWLELRLDKREILEAYLNLAPFGHEVIGVEEAARAFLDKPLAHLTVGECTALASLPRSPRRYDPYRFEARLLTRRAHVLGLVARRFGPSQDLRRAAAEPLHLAPLRRTLRAPHLVEVAAAEARRAGALEGAAVVETTLDPFAQAAAADACSAATRALADRNVTNCAALVLRASTAEVLALVGSADWDDARHDGQVDGALARRQPGSALKPFVYGLAIEHGMTAATLLEDVETRFWTPHGDFAPRNYDDRFHGPVRAREALASSYNVPAVALAERLGPEAVLRRLRALGLGTLDRSSDHYGPGIALGDGEVRLIDLVDAYATLARGGVRIEPTAIRRVVRPDGRVAPLPGRAARRIMPRAVAFLVADVLADAEARLASFGEDSQLELPFRTSVKTGTSKAYRDNWTIGFADDLVVGVWVGNFDGSAMRGVSGVTGAAPVFRSILTAVRGNGGASQAATAPPGLVEREICPLSGARPGPACPRRIHEWFVEGTEPVDDCAMHETVAIDRRTGLRAGPDCGRFARIAAFVRVPPRLERWASARGWPRAPRESSPLCPLRDSVVAPADVGLVFPREGDRFAIDPGRPVDGQAIPLRARVQGAARVRFDVDGRSVAEVAAPFETLWVPSPGEHEIVVRAGSGPAAAAVRIRVD